MTMMRNRINMHTRIEKGNNPWMKKLIRNEKKNGWIQETRRVQDELKINREKESEKINVKKQVERQIRDYFKAEVEMQRYQGKSKLKYPLEGKEKWEPAECPPYMGVLTRNQASIIFKAKD